MTTEQQEIDELAVKYGLEFGWQDPNHYWEYRATFECQPSAAHVIVARFNLYQCTNCGAYMTDICDDGQPVYETPWCGNGT